MSRIREALSATGLPAGDLHDLPTSAKRFPDGAQYRIEIPSTEGPRCLEAVLEEADRLDVAVHRVSQGSGVFMLTDAELDALAHLGAEAGVEVSLFARPNAGWTTGATAYTAAGAAHAPAVRGQDQLVAVLEDAVRAAEHGIRSVLLADVGAVAAIRAAVDLPIDFYVEAPDSLGGFVRHHEIPALIRVAAPVYVKFGLKNAPDIYPSGSHIEATAVALSRERVRRARLGMELLARAEGEFSRSDLRAASGLAVPVPSRSP
jgi:hypothetical protein